MRPCEDGCELLAGEIHRWAFVRAAGIEPTNRGAERAFRHAAIYRETDGAAGSRYVERVLMVVATCRQRKIDVLDGLARWYQAHLDGQPAPSLLDRPQDVQDA